MKKYLEELSYKNWDEMTIIDKIVIIFISVLFCVVGSFGGIE